MTLPRENVAYMSGVDRFQDYAFTSGLRVTKFLCPFRKCNNYYRKQKI